MDKLDTVIQYTLVNISNLLMQRDSHCPLYMISYVTMQRHHTSTNLNIWRVGYRFVNDAHLRDLDKVVCPPPAGQPIRGPIGIHHKDEHNNG